MMKSGMNHTMIPMLPNTHFIALREDLISLCQQATRRKPKSRSSPYCKALILAILDHWTFENLKDGGCTSFHITIPQWQERMYGMFARNVISDSLEELRMEEWIERQSFKTGRGGHDQYRYTLNSKRLLEAIGTVKNQRSSVEEDGKITDATLKNQRSYSPQQGKINDQRVNFTDATVKNHSSSSRGTVKNHSIIDNRDNYIDTKIEREERERKG